jgi:DNA-binding MarR family transcriptional regulator
MSDYLYKHAYKMLDYLYKCIYKYIMKPQLGTQLRHLIELLDGAVSAAYDEAGLAYRPRYTPVVRALMEQQPLTVGQIADAAGITQPAATQTVALMLKKGLISVEAAPDDGRQRLIRLSSKGHDMLPQLQACWQATAAAAQDLDAELPYSLLRAVEDAVAALSRKPFDERIRAARKQIQLKGKS